MASSNSLLGLNSVLEVLEQVKLGKQNELALAIHDISQRTLLLKAIIQLCHPIWPYFQ